MNEQFNEWQEAEGKTAADISVEDLDNLVKSYLEKREAYEAAKKVQTEKYNEYQRLETRLMTTLKAAGKKSYKVDGIGSATVVQKSVIQVPKDVEHKRQLWEWIKNKYGVDTLDDMLSIHSAKLTSWYNEEAEANKENPLFSVPGISAPTMVENLSFRRETK